MTVADLIEEIDDHGFEDTVVPRKEAAINFAIQWICQARPWPFLDKVLTLTFDGVSPVPSNAPADLRAVKKIMDTNNGRKLDWVRTDDVEELYGNKLTESGDPILYYFEGTQLRVWRVPSATKTLRLRYTSTPAVVNSASPESAIAIPKAYHEGILFRALMRLYFLEDDPEQAQPFKQLADENLEQMTEALMVQQYDAPDFVHAVDPDDWDYDL